MLSVCGDQYLTVCVHEVEETVEPHTQIAWSYSSSAYPTTCRLLVLHSRQVARLGQNGIQKLMHLQGLLKINKGILSPRREPVNNERRVDGRIPERGSNPQLSGVDAKLVHLAALVEPEPQLLAAALDLPLAPVGGDLDLALGARDGPADADVVDALARGAEGDGGRGAVLGELALEEDVVRGGLGVGGVDDGLEVCLAELDGVRVALEDGREAVDVQLADDVEEGVQD
jgi:hypothetical protein